MVVAVILAGGSGVRFGGSVPKQFLPLEGKPVIAHTLAAFEANDGIEEIAVVSHPDFLEETRRIIDRFGFKKVRKVLPGGKERYHSSLAAIEAYADDDWLIFHDAVRPLVSQRIINDCVEARRVHDAVDVAVKTTDTIIQVRDGDICGIPPRATLWNGQTPQCFRRSVIKAAYEKALQDPSFVTTDDCGVVFKYLPETPVHVIEGEQRNVKLTHEEDLRVITDLIRS
jgi:2-C-methyl-D-erythritol 4-phosphate cytidylyltransferase